MSLTTYTHINAVTTNLVILFSWVIFFIFSRSMALPIADTGLDSMISFLLQEICTL